MNQNSQREQADREQVLAIQNRHDGCQNRCGCESPGMQVLIHEIKSAPRYRQRKQDGNHGDRGPLRRLFRKAAAGDAPASQQHQINRQEVPGENDPAQRQVSRADGGGHHLVENGRLQLHCEEIGVVRKQRRIQIVFDSSEVDTIVFGPGMVSRNQDADERQDR